MLSDFLGWLGLLLTIWCVYFFRDPERTIPNQKNILVSPADGRVLSVKNCNTPENFSDETTKEFSKISIFMNVFNVHVNRIPVAGKVVWLKYIQELF